MTITQIRYQPCEPDDISASDLSAEIRKAQAAGQTVECYRLRGVDEHDHSVAEGGSMLWFPAETRAGIEWGADADWLDADGVEDALDRYLSGDLGDH